MISNIDYYPLSLVDFRLWLESKDKEEVVGVTVDGSCCPIANALKESVYSKEGNNVEVEFKYTTINPEQDEIIITNPSWVSDFIEKVDLIEHSDVTASDALEVVNNLHICTVCSKYNSEGTNCNKENCPW